MQPHLLLLSLHSGALGLEMTTSSVLASGAVRWYRTKARMRQFRDAVRRSILYAERGGSGLGDLTKNEVARIQSLVEQAGTELRVVGSAARAERRPGSDIDYLVASEYHAIWAELWAELPGNEHPPVETDLDLECWARTGIVFQPGRPPQLYG